MMQNQYTYLRNSEGGYLSRKNKGDGKGQKMGWIGREETGRGKNVGKQKVRGSCKEKGRGGEGHGKLTLLRK